MYVGQHVYIYIIYMELGGFHLDVLAASHNNNATITGLVWPDTSPNAHEANIHGMLLIRSLFASWGDIVFEEWGN